MDLKFETSMISFMKFFLHNSANSSNKNNGSFFHTINNNRVTLKWKNKSSLNKSLFRLERKTSDSGMWEKIDSFDNSSGSKISEVCFFDECECGCEYYYRLEKIEANGSSEYFEIRMPVNIPEENASENIIPSQDKFSVFHYPNSANTEVVIKFILPKPTIVKLTVYNDTLGEINILVSNRLKAGAHTYIFPITKDELCSFNIYYEILAYDQIKLMEMTPSINNHEVNYLLNKTEVNTKAIEKNCLWNRFGFPKIIEAII